MFKSDWLNEIRILTAGAVYFNVQFIQWYLRLCSWRLIWGTWVHWDSDWYVLCVSSPWQACCSVTTNVTTQQNVSSVAFNYYVAPAKENALLCLCHVMMPRLSACAKSRHGTSVINPSYYVAWTVATSLIYNINTWLQKQKSEVNGRVN